MGAMTPLRLFGMVSMLLALSLGAILGTKQLGGSSGTKGPLGKPALQATVDQAVFLGADASLAAFRAGTGTFVGAPAPQGVAVVRADVASYCLQAGTGTAVEHELGPGGTVQAGPC